MGGTLADDNGGDSRDLYQSDLDRHLFLLEDEEHELDEARRALVHRLERLPEKLRQVFLLRERQELSYDEIAEKLKIPLGTVKSRLARARRRVEKWMPEE